MTVRRSLLIVVALANASCDRSTERPAGPAGDPTPPASSAGPRSAAPGPSPDLTLVERTAVRSTMLRHGDTMEDLLWAALMLDAPSVAAIAQQLEADVWTTGHPPGEGDDGMDDGTEGAQLLPQRFRELQGSTIRATRALATAAELDRGAMAAAFGRLSETCIRCHEVYRPAPGSAGAWRWPPWPTDDDDAGDGQE